MEQNKKIKMDKDDLKNGKKTEITTSKINSRKK